ncbi:MAG: hypothetical protein AAGC92_14740 [Pseudomonadota bacterium]
MATVAQLVEDIAVVMAEKPETVNAYARALIDSGDLPKSKGRAIAHVDIEHVVKLFLAVILAPKIKDTADAVGAYYHLRKAGVNASFPASFQGRAGQQLCDFVQIIQHPEIGEESLRLDLLECRVCFVLNWLEIEFDFGNGKLMRFKESNTLDTWQAQYKRCVILTGRTFLMLGFGHERNYLDRGGD